MKQLRAIVAVMLFWSAALHAEQKQTLGDWEVHYVLIPTTFLKPEIAASYDIVRGADRALLNISVLSLEQQPVTADVSGHVTNLLEQRQPLEFTEIREGEAVYYLATIRHTVEEVLRFAVNIVPPDGTSQTLRFQQRVYRSEQ